jgi:hypothetical protein
LRIAAVFGKLTLLLKRRLRAFKRKEDTRRICEPKRQGVTDSGNDRVCAAKEFIISAAHQMLLGSLDQE